MVLISCLAKYAKGKGWVSRKIRKLDMSLRYESTTRFIIEILLHLSVTSLINITYGLWDTTVEKVIYGVA